MSPAVAQLAPSAEWAAEVESRYQVSIDTPYISQGGAELAMDIYSRRDVTTPQPTLVFFHGGFWVAGSKDAQMLALLPWLEMGWNVVNVGYRLGGTAPAPAALVDAFSSTYTYSGSVTGKPGLPDVETDVGGWENYPALTRPANWDTDRDGMPDYWENRYSFNPIDPADAATDAVAMEQEDLFIGIDLISVDYVFRNITAQDVTGEVIFPLPPISLAEMMNSDWNLPDDRGRENLVNFAAEVNGVKIPVKIDRIAVIEPP